MHIQTISPYDIKLPEISRRDLGDLESLAESIDDVGLLQLPVVDKDFNIIAGERRTRACRLLIDQKKSVDFAVSVRDRDADDEIIYAKCELEENNERKDFTWQENAEKVADLHALCYKRARLDEHREWLNKETGRLLGYSAGHVTMMLKVAELLKSKDTEILQAKNLREAYDIVTQRKEDEAAAALQQRVQKAQASKTSSVEFAESTPGRIHVIDPLASPSEGKKIIDLSSMLYLGDFRDFAADQPAGSFDHVITDIPYGLDMDLLKGKADVASVENEHDVEGNLELMPDFLAEAFRITNDHGFCAFWYDDQHRHYLADLAKSIGWAVQPWSIVWCKTDPCMNKMAHCNFTKATEYAMILRKPKATLAKKCSVNWFTADSRETRKSVGHPFAKPPQAWFTLYEHICLPGQRVIDFYAGAGSSILPAIDYGLEPVACELNPSHFTLLERNVKRHFNAITNFQAEFI